MARTWSSRGIMQHIEEAGIHSGDSSCVLPAVDIPPQVLKTHPRTTPSAWHGAQRHRTDEHAVSPMQRDKVFVIEVNPRASRTVPYVSKATGIPLAKIAARLMTGRKLREFLPDNIDRTSRSGHRQLLLREVAGLPVGQVPGRRYRAGAGDALDRRSDGRGRQLWRGLRQGAASRRAVAAP